MLFGNLLSNLSVEDGFLLPVEIVKGCTVVIWHNTVDASRIPEYVTAGQEVELWIGTYPIEFGQGVWVELKLMKMDGGELFTAFPAQWQSNNEHRNNSYWLARIGSFEQGDRLEYKVRGSMGEEQVECHEWFSFDVS